MRTYYEILDVPYDCSQDAIKAAFRRRAKSLHPDLGPEDELAQERMRELITAYRTLSDRESRKSYDRIHRIASRGFEFDYRRFLVEHRDEPEMAARLIFYDLFHNRESEALALFEEQRITAGFDLIRLIGREDGMDGLFLLAEAFERRGRYFEAWELYVLVLREEQREPYFRHFSQEIIDRLKVLTCFKMPGELDDESVLGCIDELIAFNFSRKDTAFYLKKAAELHAEGGRYERAAECLQEGLSLDDKLAGVKKLREKLGTLLSVN